MAPNKNLKNLNIAVIDGGLVINLGDMEIWDGADLALLREAMAFLYHQRESRSFGVDMTYVKYVPSGFFGMLFDWYERGVCIRVYNSQPHVQQMLWFTQFFRDLGTGGYELTPTQHSLVVQDHASSTPLAIQD